MREIQPLGTRSEHVAYYYDEFPAGLLDFKTQEGIDSDVLAVRFSLTGGEGGGWDDPVLVDALAIAGVRRACSAVRDDEWFYFEDKDWVGLRKSLNHDLGDKLTLGAIQKGEPQRYRAAPVA